MLRRHALTDQKWAAIEPLLPGRAGGPGPVAADNRLFVDAVIWIAKTGAPWRDLPERFGNWNSAWRRYDRWCKTGVWERLNVVLGDPDLEELQLDSTVVRAHQHAAGARRPKKKASPPSTPPSAAAAAGTARNCTRP
jgi:transposase